MSVGVFGQSAPCFEVREPLVVRLLVQPQVQGHLFGVNLPLQGADGLVVLHQLGRLHRPCVQVVVHLVVASARHVHALYEEVVDGLALVGHGAVLLHVDARQALQHVADAGVLLRDEVGQVVAHGVASAADAPGAYLHLAEHDALGAQGEVQPAAFADVARLSSVAQHRGADLQGTLVVPGQGVVSVGVGQGVVDGHAVAQHAHHHRLERAGGLGVGHAALEHILCTE